MKNKREIDEAVKLLKPLLNGIAKYKRRNIVIEVFAEEKNNENYILVIIDGGKYYVNVECCSLACMVQSVIDTVVLKI